MIHVARTRVSVPVRELVSAMQATREIVYLVGGKNEPRFVPPGSQLKAWLNELLYAKRAYCEPKLLHATVAHVDILLACRRVT